MHRLTFTCLQQAVDHLTATDERFALDQARIRGIDYTVFSNAPPHLRGLLQAVRANHDNGEADYLVYGNERWSFDAFCEQCNRLANVLTGHLGVLPGDRVAIAMRNYPEFLFALTAISSVGAVVVFLNSWWTTQELDYALQDSGAQLVFADGQRLERLMPLVKSRRLRLVGVREAQSQAPEAFSELLRMSDDDDWPTVDIDPDSDFSIMYSSGTTGHPKGVVLTHRGAMSAVYSWWMTQLLSPLMAAPDPESVSLVSKQAALVVTPLFHVTASHSMFMLGLPMGAKLVLMYKWDPEEAVGLIQREQVTRFMGVPTQSAELMESVKRLSVELPSLDFIGSGGAKRPPAQVNELHKTFPHAAIASGWGMTETNPIGIGIVGPDYLARPSAAGRLYPPLQQMKILDEDGNQLANGEIGEIAVRSAANMRCYLNKPEATAEVLQQGWLRTGDLAMVDDEGFVTIVDRKKNIIIRGGENIACLDVEGALHEHPAIMEAGVFSVPDSRLGEAVGAGIQLRPDLTATARELQEFLQGRIANFKIPEHFWFQTDELPRGATDKIDRRALRTQCLNDQCDSAAAN